MQYRTAKLPSLGFQNETIEVSLSFAFEKLKFELAPLSQVLCRSWDRSVSLGCWQCVQKKRLEIFMPVMQKETKK